MHAARATIILATLLIPPGLAAPALADPPAGLVAAAQKERQLNVIGLPRAWCGYGPLIDAFRLRYHIKVNSLNPDAGSGDELAAIRANRTNKTPQAPDVIDIGLALAPQAKAEHLLQPYKPATWASIPDALKDADGDWIGDYYGVLAFEVNKDLVKQSPADWPDLQRSTYTNAVALPGDPRSSSQAALAVYAAGLAAGAKEAGEAARAGLVFFGDLNSAGNFVPVTGRVGALAQGITPVIVRWDYNALADRATLKGNPPVDVVVPKSGVVASVYAQAISAFAPHPNAAKLWLEYLYSDEGQIGWLKGFCHPVRFAALIADRKVPDAVLSRLPPAEAYSNAVFPTVDEQGRITEIVTKGWAAAVGATVK